MKLITALPILDLFIIACPLHTEYLLLMEYRLLILRCPAEEGDICVRFQFQFNFQGANINDLFNYAVSESAWSDDARPSYHPYVKDC